MRRFLLVLLAVLLPALLAADDVQKVAWVSHGKDLTDTSYTYCKLAGTGGDAYNTATPIPGPGKIGNSGSSATIDEITAGTDPFAELTAGDVIQIQVGRTIVKRTVVTVTSAASIDVDTAVDLSGDAAGYSWVWWKEVCGTAVTDGWIPVSLATTVAFELNWVTKNATGLDYSFECRVGGDAAIVIEQASLSAAGATTAVLTSGVWDECRIGMKIDTATSAQSINALIAYKAFGR